MATTGYELQNEPHKGQDGKYQIRIESYDPARNTMKAIWLVSRNQRLLTQLLHKCEVSQTETSNAELRGNLLSVQRELQELREAMDQHDGAETPVLDTADLGMDNSGADFGRCQSSLATVWADSAMTSSPLEAGDDIQVERASSAFGFGSGSRRRNVLSQIPKYSRPSIRTDFCISSYEPFPSIRSQPSHLPKCPPVPKKKKKESQQQKVKKSERSSVPPRPKTSLSGRGSRLSSSYGDRSSSRCTSILKTSHLHVRPATSMALTGTGTKKVSFKDSLVEKPKSGNGHSRSTSLDQKKKKKTTTAATTTTRITTATTKKTAMAAAAGGRSTKAKIDSGVRPATSLGIRTIPRSSSRLSQSGLGGGSSSAMTTTKPRSGRHSAMETSSTSKRRTPSSGSTESYAQLYLDARAKTDTKKKSARDPPATATARTAASRSTKAQASDPTKKKSGKGELVDKRKPVVKSRGIESRPVTRKTSKKKATKVELPIRPKSVSDVVHPRLEVLPFESPPPPPQILSQTDSFISTTDSSTLEDSSNPLIRSVSIIDGDSENEDAFQEVKKTLPRIRVGDEPEYRVKAYFLDEIGDSQQPRGQSNPGVIPSSPVELDSTVRDTALETMRSEDTVATAPRNNTPSVTAAAAAAATSQINQVEMEMVVCNNTEGMDKAQQPIKEERRLSESRLQRAAIDEGPSTRELVPNRDQEEDGGDVNDDESSTLPGFGTEFLPEFANEVNGLLDTLMSQDMLMSSFSQDFRLFSTESNFMDTSAVATETPTRNSQKQNTTTLEEDKVVVQIPEEEGEEMEREVIAPISGQDEDTTRESSQPIIAVTEEPVDSEAVVETETKIVNPFVEEEEEVGNDLDQKESLTVQDSNECPSIVGEVMVAEGIEQSQSAHLEEEPSAAQSSTSANEDLHDTGLEARLDCEGGLEEILADAVPSSPCAVPVSPPVSFEVGIEDDGIQQQKMPIGDALQRKSTGSYDATALSKSIAAALKPRKLRRSVSQSELDAMLINNNDGCEQQQQQQHRTPSPSEFRCSRQRQQRLLEWTGADSSNADCPVATHSDRHLDDTVSVFSSSELTLPDPSETYHDVHHGYSPSFGATGKCMCDERSLPMESVDSPTLQPQEGTHHRASFDFLNGNPAQLDEGDVTNRTSDLTGFCMSIDTPLRLESQSQGRCPSARRPESLDEIEKCSSVGRSASEKDTLFKSTGSSFSVLDSTETHRKVEEGRITQISAMESIGEDSVIPAAVAVDTDEDTVEDVQGNNSTESSMDYIPPPMPPHRAACEIEIDPKTCTPPGSDHITENRTEPPPHTITKDHSFEPLPHPQPQRKLAQSPPTSRRTSDESNKPKQGKKKRTWIKSCGLFRMLTCTTSLEKTDLR